MFEIDSSCPSGQYKDWIIDSCKISNDAQYDLVADHFYLKIKECSPGIPNAGEDKQKLLDHIKVILCNLHNAYCTNPEMFIRFELGGNAYKQNKKCKAFQFGRRNIKRVIKYLNDNGYIELIVGIRGMNGSTGKLSKMRTTGKLIDLLENEYHADPATIERDTQHTETIIMKGKKKRPPKKEWKDPDSPPTPKREVIATPDNKVVQQMRTNLQVINKANQESTIELDISDQEIDQLNIMLSSDPDIYLNPIDFTQKQLYRVFVNDDLKQHGRFYGGWWQGIPEYYRDKIIINGMPTVELDYKSIHPYILYGLEGMLPALEDQYYLSDESEETNRQLRQLIKYFLLIIFNSDNMYKAKEALIYKYEREQDKAARRNKPVPVPPFELTQDNLFPVIEKLKRQHAPIAKYFFTGCGNMLMYHDSQMAEEVMLSFAKDGIPCLPIHDSFIVDVRHEDRCFEAMKAAYQNRYNQDIPVDVAEYMPKIISGSRHLPMSDEWIALREQTVKEFDLGGLL